MVNPNSTATNSGDTWPPPVRLKPRSSGMLISVGAPNRNQASAGSAMIKMRFSQNTGSL